MYRGWIQGGGVVSGTELLLAALSQWGSNAGGAGEKQSAREKERAVTLIAPGLLCTPCEHRAFCP